MNSLLSTVALALFAVGVSPAQSEEWPLKPLRLIVAYPAGGGVDFVARTISQRLSERLKQPVIVDNRGGASGAIGADFVAKASPDGYTLLLASPAEVVVGPEAGQKIPYKPEVDFEPVILVGETPLALAIKVSSESKSLAEFIAFAKGARAENLSYGTPGNGSSMHFAGEAFKAGTGTMMQHIPYRGAAPALNDALSGQVSMLIAGLPPVIAHVKSNKLRILAVTTGARSSLMPDVPTVSELPGMKDYRFSNWMTVYAPSKTPVSIIDRLDREITAIIAEPAVRERLLGAGVEPRGLGGKELAAFLSDERKRYGSVAKERNIRIEN